MVGCFLKIWLNVMAIPFAIAGIYKRSIKLMGFLLTVFDLFVNACIFYFYFLLTLLPAKIFLCVIDTNFISFSASLCHSLVLFVRYSASGEWSIVNCE